MSEKDLKIINMQDVEATEVKWLWYPYIPYGKITIIQGDPGEGKTTLVLNLAALLTRGEKLPESDTAAEPINVLYQSAEDGLADTIKPRLTAANADASRVMVIDETNIELSMTDHHLEAAIRQTGAKLVILDPLQAYLGAKVDMHRANEVRPVFKHLATVAEKYGCAIVLIAHMNKTTGIKAAYRMLGSVDITAAARSVLIVGRIKDNPTTRVMVHSKSSLAPEGEPIAFELNPETGFPIGKAMTPSCSAILSGGARRRGLSTTLSKVMTSPAKRSFRSAPLPATVSATAAVSLLRWPEPAHGRMVCDSPKTMTRAPSENGQSH